MFKIINWNRKERTNKLSIEKFKEMWHAAEIDPIKERLWIYYNRIIDINDTIIWTDYYETNKNEKII